LTDTEYNNQKSGILQMLDIEIDIAHNIVTSNPDEELKLKAANTVTKLSKTKAEILIKFRKARAELAKAEKPVYNVFIGQPKQTDLNRLKKLESTIENDEKEDNDEKEIQ
jgi:glycerol-3-phosphate cytidylyltransferase-like family protein